MVLEDSNIGLLRLLVLGAVLVIGGLCAGGLILHPYNPARFGRLPQNWTLPQSAFLIGWSVLAGWLLARGTSWQSLAILITFGMALGFVGDLFMANIFQQDETVHVLLGMAAFAVGHILYMLAFRQIAIQLYLHSLSSYVIALVVMWMVALVLWMVLIRRPDGGVLQYAALGYSLFLATMAAYALGMAVQQPALFPVAVGAILFLVSDAILGARMFAHLEFPYIGDMVWLTYIAAQLLIVSAPLLVKSIG